MNESILIQKMIQIGVNLNSNILEYSGAEADAKNLLDEIKQQCNIDSVSGCFPTDDQIRMLSSQYAEDENSCWANDYKGYNKGMKECINITKKNINNL